MRSKAHFFCTRNLALFALLAFTAGSLVAQPALSDGEWSSLCENSATEEFWGSLDPWRGRKNRS